MSFAKIEEFETAVANFFGSKYAVAVDSCTHGIELCLRLEQPKKITIPTRTYISIPFTAIKLGLEWEWTDEGWQDYYQLGESNIYDAAVLWRKDSFLKNTMMCLSFQYQKHLSLGRGGMILLDNYDKYLTLKKMSYDGREPNIPWRDQNISTIGYHYYMTPETAELGLNKLQTAIESSPKLWVVSDWPDLRGMEVFKK